MSSQTIKVTASGPGYLITQGDCIHLTDWLPSVTGWDAPDLVFCSPPYEDARTYGIGCKLRGPEWVQWALPRYVACLRSCSGLTAWVVEGKTRNFRWSATPLLLSSDLIGLDYCLRKPPIFHRVGVPGSGGPDWLRNDYEHIICATRKPGRLPWSDNTAMGHPPKWGPGGEMSYRLSDGTRRNQWGSCPSGKSSRARKQDGTKEKINPRPSHIDTSKKEAGKDYVPPKMANPGNVIKCNVGGGTMGSRLCHENEAPFPEALAEFFIRSFCPPGGIVLDPFSGSATTAAVALRCGRRAIAIDIRESQCALTLRRIKEVLTEQETSHATD